MQKRKKKLLNSKKSIFALSATLLTSGLVIAVPPVVVSLLPRSNPLLEVQNQAKLISTVGLKSEFLDDKTDYFEFKKQLFNPDGSRKTDVNLTDFFSFYQNSNSSLPIDFSSDIIWSRFKIEIVDIDPIDKEQSFEIFYRLTQDLGDQKIANSDLYKQKIAFSNPIKIFSLGNFADLAKGKLTKLRPFSVQEFGFQTNKRKLTNLIKFDDFYNEVNSAKNSVEAQEIIGKYFNLDEILEKIFGFKQNYFRDETGSFHPRFQIEIAKDPLLNLEYLSKTPKENQYNLTFKVGFSPSYIQQNPTESQKDSKFPFVVTLDLSNRFLDKSISDSIKLTEFSQDDYFFPASQLEGTENGVTSWDFFNYFNNQIFATQADKQKFLDDLLAKILKTPFLSKLKFDSVLDGLDFSSISKFLKIDIKTDSESTKLVFDNGKVVAKVVGKIIIKNNKGELIAEKDFVQDVQNPQTAAQNDLQLTKRIEETRFSFEPTFEQKVSDGSGLPRAEIMNLVKSNNFDKLKFVLENGRYYGYDFKEEKLKQLVDDYEFPDLEKFNKNSNFRFINNGGTDQKTKLVGITNGFFKNQLDVSRFFTALAKKGVNFVAKFWFNWLKHLKLIDGNVNLPENLSSNNIFSELAKIKLVTKDSSSTASSSSSSSQEDGIWLFSFNSGHLASSEKDLIDSFYVSKKFKNILDLMKNNENNLDANYFLDQILSTTKTVSESEYISEATSSGNMMKDLADLLVGFYFFVFKKNGQFLTKSIGKNYDYKIQFAVDETANPVLVSVASTPAANQDQKLKLKYWYKVGPVDEKGNLISTIFETKQHELEIKINEKVRLLTDDVQKLEEIAREFPTVSQHTFLTQEDYNKLFDETKKALNGRVNKLVDISDLIKKFPFYHYFTTNYPGFGLYVFQRHWGGAKEENKEINGIFESSNPVGVGPKQYDFWLYVYNKEYNKNRPWRRSPVPIKVIIIIHKESLLLS
ncbi:P97 family adhesin [Mycoplasma sp. 'Moose RK']|uniref:P97 family adhesin n=1 Tax=Mycoplasma sp. 'Moose RK' TaxID=2780095 RepID=UPI0018C27CD6|nr:hypothetical protein [Mycoplasma sp. 'Moose RK']MBG0730660.1 hypothetical protein [Mycoplasma sp. 'Moose RK']